MKKKSFTDNPAEQFISSFSVEKKEESNVISEPVIADKFETKKIPDGYKIDPRFIEKRSKRLNLLMQPSLYEKIQEKANEEKVSVNEFIHAHFEEFFNN